MKKKVQGRKGRPAIGKRRAFLCSDRDYARVRLAALLLDQKLSEFVRESVVARAEEIIKSHVESLGGLELDDELLKQIADEYLN
jgi:uncharacterized protein (DUF1778 family)